MSYFGLIGDAMTVITIMHWLISSLLLLQHVGRAFAAGLSLNTHHNKEVGFSPRSMRELKSQGITVMINTYKRPDMLQSAVEHYFQCHDVSSIQVVWCEDGRKPDLEKWNLVPPRVHMRGSADRLTYNGDRIQFHDVPDSLNSRFLPIEGMTTDAVFAVDDDIRVPCSDLSLAFETWVSSQHTLVGFYPRLHVKSSVASRYEYHSWWYVWWTGQYSMILTKAALFHKNYLALYSYTLPKPILDYVDEHMNCEDIAMQFLVSNVSGLPPIYVRSDVSDVGVFGGISTRSGHMGARSDCLNDMMTLFGQHEMAPGKSNMHGKSPSTVGKQSPIFDQLPLNRLVVGRASDFLSNRPATWMEYLASDLPISIPFQVIFVLFCLFMLGKLMLYMLRCLKTNIRRENTCGLRDILDTSTERRKHLKS